MPHRFDPTILREYDIRGIVGRTLSSEDARAVGRAYALTLAAAGGSRVATGYDGRLTSPELEAALVDGLAMERIDVVRIGRGPTPMLYYAAATLGVDGGDHGHRIAQSARLQRFQIRARRQAVLRRCNPRTRRNRARTWRPARPARADRTAPDPRRLCRQGAARLRRIAPAFRRLGRRERRHRRGGGAADRPVAGSAYPDQHCDRWPISRPPSRPHRAREPDSVAASGGARALRPRHRLRRRRRSHRGRRRTRRHLVGRSADGRSGARRADPTPWRSDPRRCQGEPDPVRRDRADGWPPGDDRHRAFADQGKACRIGRTACRRNERAHLFRRRLLRLRRCGLCRCPAARHSRPLGGQPGRAEGPPAACGQHAGAAVSVRRSPQIRGRARGRRAVAPSRGRDGRDRWCARAHR